MLAASQAAAATTSVTITWICPGGDGWIGSASTVELRYAAQPINVNNYWAAAIWTLGMPVPGPMGTEQQVVVSGLALGTTYYFAMKFADASGNWSGMSNVWSFTTPPVPDTTPPATISTLGGH